MHEAPRHKDFPIGRICVICGKGTTPRSGPIYGCASALRALGYVLKPETLGHAHTKCLAKTR